MGRTVPSSALHPSSVAGATTVVAVAVHHTNTDSLAAVVGAQGVGEGVWPTPTPHCTTRGVAGHTQGPARTSRQPAALPRGGENTGVCLHHTPGAQTRAGRSLTDIGASLHSHPDTASLGGDHPHSAPGPLGLQMLMEVDVVA